VTTLQRLEVRISPPHRALVLIRRWRLVVYLLLLLLVGVLAIMARPGRVTPTTSTTASALGN